MPGAAWEYALLVSLIAIVAIPAIQALGEAIKCLYQRAASVVAAAAHCGPCLILMKATVKRECRIGICFFSRSVMPEIADHIQDAQDAGLPMLLTRNRDPGCITANRSAACKGFVKTRPDGSCDEYPFASTNEGGLGASAREVPLGEQRSQGGTLCGCYSSERIGNGDPFAAVVTP